MKRPFHPPPVEVPIPSEKGESIPDIPKVVEIEVNRECHPEKAQHSVAHSETGEKVTVVEELEMTLREKQEQ
jgi:hypothetical protein